MIDTLHGNMIRIINFPGTEKRRVIHTPERHQMSELLSWVESQILEKSPAKVDTKAAFRPGSQVGRRGSAKPLFAGSIPAQASV